MSALRGNIDTLLGQYSYLGDGNIQRNNTVFSPPELVVLGQAIKGADNRPLPFSGATIDQVLQLFGAQGTLTKQVQEARSKGVESVLAKRIGARKIFLQHIGASGATSVNPDGDPENGYWLELNVGGTQYGTQIGIAYQKSDGRLVLEDLAAKQVIFDNNPAAPIDLGAVYVRGQNYPSGGGSDIGTATSYPPVTIPLASATSLGDNRIHYYGGDNGEDIPLMRLFEGIFDGFYSLENYRYKYIAMPERATINAPWGTDMTNVSTGANAPGTAYPAPYQTANNDQDKLGAVFMEEVDGDLFYYWDVNNDGKAEFWSVNDTGQYHSQSKGGHSFQLGDFEVPNFAYILGYQCYRTTLESHLCEGVIGIEPQPIGKKFSHWLGSPAAYSTDAQGKVTVSVDGTGLLGHKYLAGQQSYRAGKAYGGMVLTDKPWFDSGSEIYGPNSQNVDLGKHMTVWGTPELFDPQGGVKNNQGYYSISPAAYAGFLSGLPEQESPSNITYPAASILTAALGRLQKKYIGDARITIAHQEDDAVKVMEALTAAHPSSDYRAQLSMRRMQIIDKAYRAVVSTYLGRPIDPQEELSIQNDLNEVKNALITARIINIGSTVTMIMTDQDRALGQGMIRTENYIPFELRKITHVHNMRRG